MKGQSLLEIIIAVSIVLIIAASSVIAVLGSFSSTRLAEEETQAAFIANEGLEAVESIRNRDWAAIADGTYGLDSASGQWEFSISPDVDPSGKFTREIVVEEVRRDLSGDIVSGNGILDEDTKLVTANVIWNFTSARTNTVTLTTYLTNWQQAVDPGIAQGGPTSCAEYCQGSGYSNGVCRNNVSQCNSNGETNLVGGNQFCTTNPQTTCCCQN